MLSKLFHDCALYTSIATVVAVFAFAGRLNRGLTMQPDELKVLRERIEALEAERQALDFNVSSLSQFSPPIGSVIAFAGDWPPPKTDGTKWTESALGWMLCDGRELIQTEHESVRSVLGGATKLPDYRGYFLRGLDSSGARDKGSLVKGSRLPRKLGSEQGYLTARPSEEPFVTDEAGRHNHELKMVADASRHEGNIKEDKWTVINRPDLTNRHSQLPIKEAGDHTHQINAGGDLETRPVNVAIHWIIKVSAPRPE